jgi:bacillithiol system protein YtxJ
MRKWFQKKSAGNPSVEIRWKSLTSLGQLDDIDANSNEAPVVIFKHSTRCGISSMVLRRFEKELAALDTLPQLYLLDLIAFRDVSNSISQRYGVVHESPQLLLIQEGRVVHHASHYSISANAIKERTAN